MGRSNSRLLFEESPKEGFLSIVEVYEQIPIFGNTSAPQRPTGKCPACGTEQYPSQQHRTEQAQIASL